MRKEFTPPPPPLTFLATALAALVLALPAGEVHAQRVGQAACPDGVTQNGTGLRVSDVKADRATLGGRIAITRHDISGLTEVTASWPARWYSATLYLGVRGYGYSDSDRDARSFGGTTIQVQDGDLIHGAWLHVGRVGINDLTPSPTSFRSLISSTKYVAQLVVGELRNRRGEDMTNQFLSGTPNPINRNKPKPVLAQVCFETAAS